MEDLSLHILDIAENATAAGATLVEISIRKNTQRDVLELTIKDNGRGMDRQMLEKVRDPFVTTRTTRRVGLGLPFLDQAARETGGALSVTSQPGHGTEVRATFQASHIDRKPLGDIAGTVITLILGNPDIDFVYESDFDGETTSVDTREIKAALDGTKITEPAVLEVIRELLQRSADPATDGGKSNG
jgi:hypothetical protein